MTSMLKHNLIAGLLFSRELWKNFVRKPILNAKIIYLIKLIIYKIKYFNIFKNFSNPFRNVYSWNQYNVQLGEYFNCEIY